MTNQEIIQAASGCIQRSCAECPLSGKPTCKGVLLAALESALAGAIIKCSDPRVNHEFGRGEVLMVTLQDEGREAGRELVNGYIGGYLELYARRG